MKTFLFWSIVLAGLAAAGAAGYQHYTCLAERRRAVSHKAVHRGDVTLVVNSTGTVQPVLSVQVGAFVSGPIQKVCVDFNDKVKKDQILAQIDPRNYKAAEAHERAAAGPCQGRPDASPGPAGTVPRARNGVACA